MTTKPGYIVTHREFSPLGIINDWHEWRGGPKARLSGYAFGDIVPQPKVGEVKRLGHLRLRIIEWEPWLDSYVVMQDGWRARLTAEVWKAWHVLEGIYRRLIVTAAVWGLADYHPATIPTWRDLRPPWR